MINRTFGATLAVFAAAGVLTVASAQSQDGRAEVAYFDEERYSRVPTIPSGTDIPVTLDEDIPVQEDRMGDTFEGHITRDVKVDGEVVLVSGAPVEVKLVESDRKDAATLRLTKVHVNGDMRSVTTEPAEADAEESGLSTEKKTAAGAAAGAVIGAVTGAGILEGAIIGAGGGLAWGLLDGDQPRRIDDDTALRFSLERELRVD